MSSPPPAPMVPTLSEEDNGQRKPYGKRYPRVWTKDAHGGAYKISMGPGAKSGYDALEEKPDGTALVIEPGYEKPPTGATTNFVGNHMTQGAIDLAQDALTAPDPDREARLERLEQARGATRLPPVQLHALPSTEKEIDVALRPAKKTPIERYTWSDTETAVTITIKACDLSTERVPMQYPSLVLGTSNANDAPTNLFSLEIPKSKETNDAFALILTLHADTHPTNFTLYHDHDTDSGYTIKITLQKVTPQLWPALKTSLPLALLENNTKYKMQPPPDLAALRRKIIQRREGALADRLPWRTNSPPLALGEGGSSDQTVNGAVSDEAEDKKEDPTTAFVGGTECAARGAYAEAVERFTNGLRTSPDDAHLLSARAKARRNLGSIRDAICDFSAARVALTGDDDSTLAAFMDATLALGECRMECEQYHAATGDFQEALRVSPKSFPASEGLRRARQLERRAGEVADLERERAATSAARGDVTGPRFVRPGMARFEDRGKSGKPF